MANSITLIDEQTRNPSTTQKRKLAEDLVGFVTVSAVSVAAIFMLTGLYSGLIDALMRCNSFALLRGFGGIL